MSIIGVGQYLPPGITGNPYTADDISKFFDMNWPDHAGILSEGFSAPGLGRLGQGSGEAADGSDGPITITSSPIDYTGSVFDPFSPLAGAAASSSAGLSPSSVNLSNVFSASGTSNVVPLTPAQQLAFQSSLSPAQQAQLIAAVGNSAVSLIRTAAGGPYTVAGTNLVYNPATGQLSSAAAGITSGLNLASISSYLPAIGLALAAWLVISSVGKR